MRMILDLALDDIRTPKDYLALFGLPQNTPTEVFSPALSLKGEEDRVIFVTSLAHGGNKAQGDLLRDHPGVSQWYVLSEGTKPYLLDMFKAKVVTAEGTVQLFSQIQDLKEALAKPVLQKNHCLLCAMDPQVSTKELEQILSRFLEGWQFQTAVLSEAPDILEQTMCSQVVLVGRDHNDFLWKQPLPKHLMPLLVMTQLEDHPYTSKPALRRLAAENVLSLSDWGTRLRQENVFPVSIRYEQWRLRLAEDPDFAGILAKEPGFVMWDNFRLPLSPLAYTYQNMAHFLAQFNGCQLLAQRITGET